MLAQFIIEEIDNLLTSLYGDSLSQSDKEELHNRSINELVEIRNMLVMRGEEERLIQMDE